MSSRAESQAPADHSHGLAGVSAMLIAAVSSRLRWWGGD